MLYRQFVFAVLMLLVALPIWAQTTLKGVVVDSLTMQPIVGASILLNNVAKGTSTDNKGSFAVPIAGDISVVTARMLGYKPRSVVPSSLDSTLVIFLQREDNEIDVVSISRKVKYNRKNPATELIDLVIQHKSQNRLAKKDSLYFEQYEKIKFGIVNPSDGFQTKMGSMGFFFQNVDSTVIKGKTFLALYLEEKLSENYLKQNLKTPKRIILDHRKTDFPSRYVNNPNIEGAMNYILQPVDVYDESIFLVNRQFLSPIADNAKLYYKYWIIDTVRNEDGVFAKLRFEPFNPSDLLFNGVLQISLDGGYAVKAVDMYVNEQANLNFVNDLEVSLSYYPDKDGVMLQDTTRVRMFIGRKGKDAFFAERYSLNSKYDLSRAIPPDVFSGAPVETKKDAARSLTLVRPVRLSDFEQSTYADVERLNQDKTFRSMLAIGYVLAQSYFPLGKFELGPLEYMFHQNDYEGNRFRIGGRSTQELSDKVYLEGYLAYGTRDETFKFYTRAAVSLNGKAVTTFPAHYLEGTIQQDVFEPGKNLGMQKGDSFFQGLRRNRPFKWMDTDAYRLGHVVEFGNHISVATHLTHQRRYPVGNLVLPLSSDTTRFLDRINTNDVQVVLRWAPYEKFYYRNLTRSTVVEQYPVFTVQYNKGLKGFWGAAYNYDALRVSATKRWFMNQLGFGDMTVSVGKIWGALPYTLLEMPNIQESGDRHTISYDLTNSMEFVADQFVKTAYHHQLQGYIFNKIPLIKKLRLREIFGAQLFYGTLSDLNNPYISDRVIMFDKNNDGQVFTHALNSRPYVEGYAGLDNILRILRVQYMFRVNYLHNPNVTRDRIRVVLNINF